MTDEEHRPSLLKPTARKKTLTFVVSVQHAKKNTNTMIQCENCQLWHLVYSKYKLTAPELSQLTFALTDYTYTCGASLSDLDLSGRLKVMCVHPRFAML